MGGSPGLFTVNFFIDAEGFKVKILENIIYFNFAFKFRVEYAPKLICKFFFNNKDHFAESGFNGIIYRIVDDGFAVRAKAIHLFHTSVTAGHTGRQNK
ncbi:hypothetical protein D9M68_731930 [compost metagenome]